MKSTPVKSLRIEKKIFLLLTGPHDKQIMIDAMLIICVEPEKYTNTIQLLLPPNVTKITLRDFSSNFVYVTETPKEILKLIKES